MTTIHLLRRQPGKAYLDGHLWLPKTHFRQEQVSSVLTYVSKNGEYIEAWEETDNHFKVPRNFLDRKALGGLPFPVVDARFTQFPTASLRSRVTLGSRNPGTAFQQEGADALLRTYDGILCLRCGAGKTVVALHAASQLNTPVLIVVNDRGLARQWAEAIETFLGVPPDEIGRIGGDGSPFDWKHDICIALVQTLASRASKHALPAEVTQHFGVVILDEAHIMGAPYFNTAIPPFQGRRWGLTATPTREDAYDSLLRRTVGPVVYTYLKPDLVPTVYFKALNTTLDTANPEVFNATHDKSGEFHYGMTYGYLAREDTERTATIADRKSVV